MVFQCPVLTLVPSGSGTSGPYRWVYLSFSGGELAGVFGVGTDGAGLGTRCDIAAVESMHSLLSLHCLEDGFRAAAAPGIVGAYQISP